THLLAGARKTACSRVTTTSGLLDKESMRVYRSMQVDRSMPTVSRLMARLRLEQLGYLRGGFPARTGTTDRAEQGRFRALQAKDLRPDGSIAWDQLTWVSESPLPGKYRVTIGDVVMPLRSTPFRATVIRDAPPDVVAV